MYAQEVKPGVVLGFDADGALVGIDINHASKNANLGRLEFQGLVGKQAAV